MEGVALRHLKPLWKILIEGKLYLKDPGVYRTTPPTENNEVEQIIFSYGSR